MMLYDIIREENYKYMTIISTIQILVTIIHIALQDISCEVHNPQTLVLISNLSPTTIL